MVTIGIDLHSNRFTAAFNYGKDNIRLKSYYLTDTDIEKFKSELHKDDYVIIEASTNTFAFSDLIEDCVEEVIIVDPSKFKAISNSSKKTDKIDARTLSKMGRYHVETGKKFLPTVYKVDGDVRTLRSLFTTYNLYTKEIVRIKNRIHSIFKEHLNVFSKSSIFKKIRYELDKAKLDEGARFQLNMLFDSLDSAELKKKKIKEKILSLGEPYQEDIDILVSISGVSVFTALGLISDYGTVERFKNAKAFSKYLRSTPRAETSNDKTRYGKTQKNGRKLSMILLLQSMNHFKRENPYIGRFYGRLKKGKGAGKARAAVIRKMLVAMFFMLREKEYYRYMNTILHERKMEEYRRFLEKNKKIA